MRIGIVSRELAPFHGGGVGTYAATLARALVDAGHRVDLITENRVRHDPLLVVEGGLRTHRLNIPGSGMHWLRAVGGFSAAAAKRVCELHAARPFDAVEFPDTEGAGAALVAFGSLVRQGGEVPRVVVSLHASSVAMEQTGSTEMHSAGGRAVLCAMERLAVRGADAVTCPSSAYASWARDVYGLPATPEVIANPLDWPHRAGPVRSKSVLYAGRLEPGKGVEDLVRAWAASGLAERGWTLRLVGRDTKTAPGGGSMRSLLLGLGAAGLEILPAVDRSELAGLVESSAFVVVPSRWENFPYTAAEALGSGRAAVVSDGGGTRELLDPAVREQLVFPAGDVGALARVMRRMAESEAAELTRFGAVCASYVRSLCDPKRVVAQRLRVYSGSGRRGGDHRGEALRWWRGLADAGGLASPGLGRSGMVQGALA